MEISYLRCCFCGNSKPIHSNKYDGGIIRLGALTVDPSDYPIVQLREVRAGPGRGHKGKGQGGWPVIGTLSITEVLEDPEYSDLGLQVKDRLIAIVRSYIDAGVIAVEEITG
ncbi:hypothetical protein ES703_33447 [subsurface metagenome]